MATLNDILEEKKDNIEMMFDEKQRTIKTSQDRKENSIIEAAVRRDAALFTSVEDGLKTNEELKIKHNYWLTYFKEMYYGK